MLRVKLTKKDCEKGYHNWEKLDKTDTLLVENCLTCGEVVEYPILDPLGADSRWAENHKLDLLQPKGKTKEDFYYYWGDPFK